MSTKSLLLAQIVFAISLTAVSPSAHAIKMLPELDKFNGPQDWITGEQESTAYESAKVSEAPKISFSEAHKKLHIILADRTTYAIPLEPTDPTLLRIYNEMPENMKVEFQQKRREILKALVQGVKHTKFGMGIGSIVGSKISWVAQKVMAPVRAVQMRELKEVNGPLDWLVEPDSTAYEPKDKEPKLKISERGHKVITGILEGMDKSMWEKAPLVAHSNEYGVYLAVGAMAEGGMRSKGFGGQYGLGISIGVNKESKAVVFQFFQSVEGFKNTIIPLAAYAGANVKIGLSIAENSPGHEHLKTKGTVDYPLAIPVFKADNSSRFVTGMSVGLFPPPPFDTLLTFKNHNNETVIARITASPLTKGFVQFKSGIDGNNLIIQPINQVYQKIKMSVNGTVQCRKIHLN